MSRIGKVPISIPSGVQINLSPEGVVNAKGPKGELHLETRNHVSVKQEDSGLYVTRHGDGRQDRAYHGLYHRLITNLVVGVTEGFSRELILQGVGYRAQMDGKTLVLNVGLSHEVRYPSPEGIAIATPEPTRIVVSGVDKQRVGQTAAEIRAVRPPEPYKGKGIRYGDEVVRRKEGKSGAA